MLRFNGETSFLRSWSYVTPVGHWQGKVESEADLAGMSGWQNFAKWKEMYHSGAEEAAIRSTLPFWHVGKQIWRRLGLKKKEANPYQEDRRNQYGSTIGGRRWHRSSLPRRWLNEIQLRQRHMCRIRPSFVQELKPMTGVNALWTLPQLTVGTTTNRDWKMS